MEEAMRKLSERIPNKRENLKSAPVPTSSEHKPPPPNLNAKKKPPLILTDTKECFVLDLMSHVERIPKESSIPHQERITTCSLVSSRVTTSTRSRYRQEHFYRRRVDASLHTSDHSTLKNEPRSRHRNALVLQDASLPLFCKAFRGDTKIQLKQRHVCQHGCFQHEPKKTLHRLFERAHQDVTSIALDVG